MYRYLVHWVRMARQLTRFLLARLRFDHPHRISTSSCPSERMRRARGIISFAPRAPYMQTYQFPPASSGMSL